MLHGDLSNQRSFNIGFRCENTLLIPKNGVQNAIPNLVIGKWNNATIDEQVLKTMNDIYWNTEYTVSLIVDSENFKSDRFRRYLDDFPFNAVDNVIRSISEVTMWLNTGQLTYFVTNDIIEKSLTNHRYAMTLDEFLKIYRRRGRRRE